MRTVISDEDALRAVTSSKGLGFRVHNPDFAEDDAADVAKQAASGAR